MCCYSRIALIPLTGLLLITLGCATPKHTNTLIFGTSTRVAFDVSQDPTGAVGVTLGYKRQEAVWMPLQANEKQGRVGRKDCLRQTARRMGIPKQRASSLGSAQAMEQQGAVQSIPIPCSPLLVGTLVVMLAPMRNWALELA